MVQAAERASDYLLSHQSSDGAWRDFRTEVGVSTSWVTGYVLSSLAGLRDVGISVSEPPIESAIRFLESTYLPGKGWGYNKSTAVDADSTAWALLGINAWQPDRLPTERDLLTRYIGPSGGICTFVDVDRRSGWRAEHPDPTASCLQAMLGLGYSQNAITPCVSSLLKYQRRDGKWNAYWYLGASYTTLHALRALRNAGIEPTRYAKLDKNWVERVDLDQGFQLALVLEICYICDQPSTPWSERLLKSQAVDGRWISLPFLRITNPEVAAPWVDPLDSGSLVSDQNCLFTTSTVMNAFAAGIRKNSQRVGENVL